MADGMITVVQLCGVCNSELGTFSVKKENLMLSVKEPIWCDTCQLTLPANRDILGRNDSIETEVGSYPSSMPGLDVSN